MATALDVTIREATLDDAVAIAQVHVASWRWAYEGLLPDSVLDELSVDDRAEWWRSAFGGWDGTVIVAVDGQGSVVGFASVGPTGDDDVPDRTGQLFAIYVVPAVAGTGTGLALLDRAESILRNEDFVRATLWVLETNQRARRFYERHGWSWDGTRGEHRFDCGNQPIVRYARGL